MDFYSLIKDQVKDKIVEELSDKKNEIESFYNERKNSLETVTLKNTKGSSLTKIINTDISFEDLDWTLFLASINVDNEIEAKVLLQQYMGTHQVSDEVLEYFGLNSDEVNNDERYFNPNNVDYRFINDLRTKFNAKKQIS
jgi:hypothetical protein